MVVLLVRFDLLGTATVSGTCADFASMTHPTELPVFVKRSRQVSICQANWLLHLCIVVALRSCTAGIVLLLMLTNCGRISYIIANHMFSRMDCYCYLIMLSANA